MTATGAQPDELLSGDQFLDLERLPLWRGRARQARRAAARGRPHFGTNALA